MHFHQIILKHLLDYHNKYNQSFTFLVRQRSYTADKNYPGGKFAHGLVFRGNDNYCSVGIIDKSGGNLTTRSVSLLFTPSDLGYNVKLEILFKNEKNPELIKFYQELASKFDSIKWTKDFQAMLSIGKITKEDPSVLFKWLDENYNLIQELALKSEIKDLIPSNDKFNKLIKNLDKKIKEAVHNRNLTERNFAGKDVKEKFSLWLEGKETSNKRASYLRAIDILNELLNEDIYSKKDIRELTGLYEDLKLSQSDENSKYYYAAAPSYGNNGFYSASIKAFIEFLNDKNNNQKSIDGINNVWSHHKNLILYGPPGTGKTYSTKEISVRICNPEFMLNKDLSSQEARMKIIEEYERLSKAGQIVFTTFHQSMSYEDFVEGIKPSTKNENVVYDIEDGIFKLLSDFAKDNWEANNSSFERKLSFDDAFSQLKEDWDENNDIKFPMKTEGKDFTIIGFTNKSIQFKKASGGTGHTLSINTLREGFYDRRKIRPTGVGIYYPSIIDRLVEYNPSNEDILIPKSYVLIIDEINRGNVSAIFGELITLLESDKRLGEKEEIKIKLPYSKQEFSVPSNLYIIGTMNTADRSVEALDTALRRRFEFKEVMPDYKVIKDENVEGIKLSKVLKTINDRIELLIDRDHLIGHSYFVNVNTPKKLANAFNNKIVPLLQEYFYGDYGKIGLVLGQGFVEKINNDKVEFADFDYENSNDFKTTTFNLKKVNISNIIEAVRLLIGEKVE